jgi:hypothetical protein
MSSDEEEDEGDTTTDFEDEFETTTGKKNLNIFFYFE